MHPEKKVVGMTVEKFINKANDVYKELISWYFTHYDKEEIKYLEKEAWKNSLPELADVLKETRDEVKKCRIYFELEMPGNSKRLDAIILGKDFQGNKAGVVIELKKWISKNFEVEDIDIRYKNITLMHPSDQARGYRDYLLHTSKTYADSKCTLKCCSYVHSKTTDLIGKLRDYKFLDLLEIAPMFTQNEKSEMAKWVSDILIDEPSEEYITEFSKNINNVKNSRYLMDTVSSAIRDEPSWYLIGEQRKAYNTIMDLVNNSDNEKHLVIVSGEPGTGKSAIALQVVGELLRKNISCGYIANGEHLIKSIQSKVQIKYDKRWPNYVVKEIFQPSYCYSGNENVKKPNFEVAICDEAHRFRINTSFGQNGKGNPRNSKHPQGELIMKNVRVLVAFIDEKQILKRQEEGTIASFVKYALEAEVKPENIHGPIELKEQFRCAGNKEFVRAIDDILYKEEKNVFYHRNFDLHVYDSVRELEDYLQEKVDIGSSARLVAGYCWDWFGKGNGVEIASENWVKPWNKMPERASSTLPPDKHPIVQWATRSHNQLDEVGCVYSTIGFEYEYIGVIWGEDLVFRNGKWIAQPEKNFDKAMVISTKKENGKEVKNYLSPDEAIKYLKNAYRILCTRGIKGCAIYCVDKETREFLKEALIKEVLEELQIAE